MSDRTLRTLTWLLVGAIALIAFAVSFEAISAYAVAVGAFPRPLRWCAPLLVDAFTVAACLVILARSRDGERAVYAWSLVVVASTVSVALNVAHAPPHTPARLVASLPPAALLAALELAMSEARRLRARADRAQADAPSHPSPRNPHPKATTPRRPACRRPQSRMRRSAPARSCGPCSPRTGTSPSRRSWPAPASSAAAPMSCCARNAQP